jgi:hypothetical protein
MISVTSCYNCGDRYKIPHDLDINKETRCLKCGKLYIPRINKTKMPLFVFEALKRVKGEK